MSVGKRIRGAAVRAFGKTACVRAVESMSPNILRLRVEAEALRGIAFEPGTKVKLHVGGGEMRSYTPASLDPQAGRMDIVFHAHGDSAASRWVKALRRDDEISFVGPAPSVAGPAPLLPWAGFYGDETTIGLAEAIANAVDPATPLWGAIEAAPQDGPAVAHLPFDAAVRKNGHGHALVEHLAAATIPDGPGVVWLSGEAGSVLALRSAILDRGVPRASLRIKPYWSLQGKAHRKELERTVLRA